MEERPGKRPCKGNQGKIEGDLYNDLNVVIVIIAIKY